MNKNEEVEAIAKKIYKKYKPAFELVMKYGAPGAGGLIPHNLVELIENETSLYPARSNNTYVRFIPKILVNEQARLVERGYLLKENKIEDEWLFLFEFHITNKFINFEMKIGKYDDQEVRQRLYELFVSHKDIFNCVSKKGLSPTWHQAFKREIVTPKKYNEMYAEEDYVLYEYIENRFKVVLKDVEKIVKVILES